MTLLLIILMILFVLYLVGCYLAYGAIKADRSEYTRWEMVKYTLGSWLTVVIGLIGHVQ